MSSSASPPPSVPYGPDASTPVADPTHLSSEITAEGVAKGVGSTAVKWGIRIVIGFVIQAIFRGLAKR
jgi:hypothetical protein